MKKVFIIFLSVLLLLFSGCNLQKPYHSEQNIYENNQKALDAAKFYLSSTPYSYSGLVAALEKEGFSYQEAIYAAENCGADWYTEAVKCAAELLEFSTFTKEALVFQLEIKGFTLEQANYGAEHNGY